MTKNTFSLHMEHLTWFKEAICIIMEYGDIFQFKRSIFVRNILGDSNEDDTEDEYTEDI